MTNPADRAINSSNFVAAAKMIEYNNIQPALLQGVMKQQVQRNLLKYAYPATIGNAAIHRDAYKFGYSPSKRGETPRVCPCCEERVDKEQIGICYNTSKVQLQEQMGYSQYKLSPGISLFFSFISMIVIYFVFRFLICDGFNLLTNIIAGHFCEDGSQTECDPILWNLLSIYNKKQTKFLLIQDILSLVVVVLPIIFFFIYRKRQYNKAKILNSKNQVEEDYTILVQNIPLIDFPSKNQAKKMRTNQGETMEFYHRQHLWKLFETKVKNWVDRRQTWRTGSGSNQADFANLISKNNGQLRSQQIVKSISLCYNLHRLQTLQSQRNQLVRNSKKYEKLRRQLEDQQDDSGLGIEQVQSDNRFSSIAKQVSFLNDCEIILNKQYASNNSVLFNITNFVGKAFISFQYQHYREYILEEADRDMNFLIFNGARLKVSRVPNPKNIIWKNLRHSRQKQRKKGFTTIFAIAIIIGICFGLLCATEVGRFKAEQAYNKDNNSIFGKTGMYGFVGLAIFIILVSNQIIFITAKIRTKQQNHYTKDNESLSVIIKSVIGQFICTAILPYVVSRIFNTQIAGRTGLIFEMTSLIIIYGFIVTCLSLIFPKAIIRIFKLCKYRNKLPQQTVDKFQLELNRDFQYIKFDIVNRYVNYLVLIFATSFYAYLIPVVIPILVVIFFLQYWIDKLNLFKRCSHPRNFSFFLTRNILKIFQANIFIFALGAYIFSIYVHNNAFNLIQIIGIGIATLYLWFLLGVSIKMQRRLFGSYESSQSAIYDDCAAEGKFEETFWTQNPATYLVKQSEITGRQHVYNPVLNKLFVTNTRPQSMRQAY